MKIIELRVCNITILILYTLWKARVGLALLRRYFKFHQYTVKDRKALTFLMNITSNSKSEYFACTYWWFSTSKRKSLRMVVAGTHCTSAHEKCTN